MPIDLEAAYCECRAKFLGRRSEHISTSSTLIDVSTASVVFPRVDQDSSPVVNSATLDWYCRFLNQRFSSIAPSMIAQLPSIPTLFCKVSTLAREEKEFQEIADHLLHLQLIIPDASQDASQLAATITFAILGWQSMLYDPVIPSNPSAKLLIADVLDGFPSQALMKLELDQPKTKCGVADLLLGFGLMLPKGNQCTSEVQEDHESFADVAVITPGGINASILKDLAGVKVMWVDVIAPHLDFDKATNTLFLYRFPSFCLANATQKQKSGLKGVIHCLAASNDSSPYWATETEITQFLTEILLSYRVLFGQAKDSRRLFRSMQVFGKDEPRDPLLYELCSTNSQVLNQHCKEREAYRLTRDFPILRQRFAILQQQLSGVKPQGWRAIWKDKRDSAQWYTFWAVLVIGGSGVFLALIQVILQILQLSGIK